MSIMTFDRRYFLAVAAVLPFVGASAKGGEGMFRIGVITDVQYADEDDNPPRLYRASPAKLSAAVAEFNRHDLAFVAHLGDFIDRDWTSFSVLKPLAVQCRHPWRFVLGNHDFNIDDDKKSMVSGLLGMPARYYDFVYGGWRFVVLDGNDLSTYGWSKGSPQDEQARAIRAEKYPNAKPWNGGIGQAQLAWLEEILRETDKAGTPVALLCHFPVYPPTDDTILLWNAGDVVAAIEPHPSVKVWLNGHEHKGGYGVHAGVHYLNLKGALDTDQNAFAIIDFHRDRLVVHGYGREESRTLILR